MKNKANFTISLIFKILCATLMILVITLTVFQKVGIAQN